MEPPRPQPTQQGLRASQVSLKTRLLSYTSAPVVPPPDNPSVFAEAIASSSAASATASALIICSHTRELRGGDSLPSWVPPGHDELEELAAEPPAETAEAPVLQFRSLPHTISRLAQGAPTPDTAAAAGTREAPESPAPELRPAPGTVGKPVQGATANDTAAAADTREPAESPALELRPAPNTVETLAQGAASSNESAPAATGKREPADSPSLELRPAPNTTEKPAQGATPSDTVAPAGTREPAESHAPELNPAPNTIARLTRASDSPAQAGTRKVLLIGWDAADWKVARPLMDAGEMPNLKRLVERGASAAITTLQPSFSPMLWTSIATGKRPFRHGVHGFAEPQPDGRGVQRISNLSRKCKALWNILGQSGLRSIVVGWWPSYPAEPIRGAMVSDHFQRATPDFKLLPGLVEPASWGEQLAALRVNPEDLSADVLEFFVSRARELDQNRDPRLLQIARVACECANIQAAATFLMARESWDLCAVYFDAIDHFGHGFMKFNPPRRSEIGEEDFALYQHVVKSGYRLHDKMLGTLLDQAGDQTTVILLSDHGFHSDHLRPAFTPQVHAGPVSEHRNNGIFVIAGPGIRKGAELTGINLLDITPTVLGLFGLPIGSDMDGSPVIQAFESGASIAMIPSWEKVEGDGGMHPPHMHLDAVAATESLEQLVALGYVEEPDADHEKSVKRTLADLRTNLAEAYQDAGRHAEAVAILRELRESDPSGEAANDQRIALRLFVSAFALRLGDEMKAIAEDWAGRRRILFEKSIARVNELRSLAHVRAAQSEMPLLDAEQRGELRQLRRDCRYDPSLTTFFRARVFQVHRRWNDALACLDTIPARDLIRPGLLTDRAELLGRLNRWSEAAEILSQALAFDDTDARVHFGLARLALHRGDFELAAHSALNGIDLLRQDPMGHYVLGISLARLRDFEGAWSAFEQALAVNPNFPRAHLWLGRIRRRHLTARSLPSRMAPLSQAPVRKQAVSEPAPRPTAFAASARDLPPITDEAVIVTGLPRSGTSMLMQMIVAGGLTPLTDGIREADEDNPRGYYEFEPVKQMAGSAAAKDLSWVSETRGKVVKIVAPMIPNLPEGLSCRVVLIERDLDEILASQQQMILRRGRDVEQTEARRNRLKQEYLRMVVWTKGFLAGRPNTKLMCVDRNAVLRNPQAAAEAINRFLGGNLDVESMAGEVKPELHRQRAAKT